MHCRDTEHLMYCEHHQCTDAYKCPGSYCIALHMVCDGVNDCPDKEDEHHCDSLETSGLLYCRDDNIYIHPRHVCDGVLHCMISHDDETVCEDVVCPDGCRCVSFTILCMHANIKGTDLPESLNVLLVYWSSIHKDLFKTTHRDITILDLSHSHVFLGMIPTTFFDKISSLNILYFRNTSIATLRNSPFLQLEKLQDLSLQDNKIPILHQRSFKGLSSVTMLNLCNLSITFIHSNTFLDLGNLKVLNLSHNRISTLHRGMFTALSHRLIVLDLQRNMITAIEWECFKYFSTLSVFTTQAELCCATETSLHCYNDVVSEINCKRSTTKYYILFALWILILYLSVSICLGLVNLYSLQVKNEQSIVFMQFTSYAILMLMTSVLSVVSDHYYVNTNIYTRDYRHKTIWCYMNCFLHIAMQCIPNEACLALTQIRKRITVHALSKPPYTMKQLILYTIACGLVNLVIAVVWTTNIKSFPLFHCVPFVTTLAQQHSLHISIGLFCLGLILTINVLSQIATVKLSMTTCQFLIEHETKMIGATTSKNKMQLSSKVQKTFLQHTGLQILCSITQVLLVIIPLFTTISDDVFSLMFLSYGFSNVITHMYLCNRKALTTASKFVDDHRQRFRYRLKYINAKRKIDAMFVK